MPAACTRARSAGSTCARSCRRSVRSAANGALGAGTEPRAATRAPHARRIRSAEADARELGRLRDEASGGVPHEARFVDAATVDELRALLDPYGAGRGEGAHV